MDTNTILPGIINDASSVSSWLLLILGIAIVVSGFVLVYYYLTNRGRFETLKISTQDLSGWSFRGFWGRYKGPIVAFSAALLLILALIFISGGIVGMDNFGQTTYT